MTHLEVIVGQIRDWVYERFPAAKERQVGDSDSLLESGIIDSMGTLEVVDFLEKGFGVEILDDEMVADHFDSIQSIAGFVDGKRSNSSIDSD